MMLVVASHDGERCRINGTKLIFWDRAGNDGAGIFQTRFD